MKYTQIGWAMLYVPLVGMLVAIAIALGVVDTLIVLGMFVVVAAYRYISVRLAIPPPSADEIKQYQARIKKARGLHVTQPWERHSVV